MGRDKAAIEIDGIPLIRRIHDVAIAPVASLYIVTPWVERYQSILPRECNFIAEAHPHQGPLMGFSQGLAQINCDWVLLLACDLPNLSTPVIQSWIDRLRDVPANSIAYLPKHPERGWEPLCGLYRHRCIDSLLEYIKGGGRSFQGWLRVNIVTELAIDDSTILLNCNTPADIASIINPLS